MEHDFHKEAVAILWWTQTMRSYVIADGSTVTECFNDNGEMISQRVNKPKKRLYIMRDSFKRTFDETWRELRVGAVSDKGLPMTRSIFEEFHSMEFGEYDGKVNGDKKNIRPGRTFIIKKGEDD